MIENEKMKLKSRKEDLTQLCYLLAYLLEDGNQSVYQQHLEVTVGSNSSRCRLLYDFVDEILRLRHGEAPNYIKL